VNEAAELTRIVEKTNVDQNEATIQKYSKDMSFVSSLKPKLLIKPGNTSEIQKIIKMARQTRTPLIPISSGAPHFRGDTVPTIEDAIIVDLSGMKEIIHVSRKHRMVMFEPGVTFGELIEAVAREGMRLNIPLAPRQTKSVLGSLLEREPPVMPIYHWDISDPTGCFEIVFGNGELFRTGAAAGSGTIEEQWAAGGSQKEAAGPSSASWYRLIQGAQGTMGIVTWGTARCEILPKLEEPFFIGSSDLNQVTDILHWLVRLRLVNECLVLNNVNTAALMGKNNNEYQAIKTTLPPWIIFFNIAAYDYFPQERIDGQVEDMLVLAKKWGVSPVKNLSGISARDLLTTVQKPSSEPFWKLRNKGNCQDIFFITIYENLEKQIQVMSEVAPSCGFASSDIGIYLQPIVQGVNCHCEFNLFYNHDEPSESERVQKLTSLAVERLIDAGAFFSRPYGQNTMKIMSRDKATIAALKKIKQIADPDNIMNPGKLCF
jgi:FAD/FMN-containing dehydrogenase